MRPDRRLQFLHEGNSVKSLFQLLKGSRPFASTLDLNRKFFAVSLGKVSDQSRKAMDAAFIGVIKDAPDVLVWAVDRIYETLSPEAIASQIEEMVTNRENT